MADSQQNATRMELTKLKNQMIAAKRGHKLLKDKQDEMIRQFLIITKNYKDLRVNTETKLFNALNIYNKSQSSHSKIEIYEKMMIPSNEMNASFHKKSIMGIDTPKISFTEQSTNITFSLVDSDSNLDESILELGKSFNNLLELAENDKTCRQLAKEIEKVRRRVNAIEYFMIPELQAQIKVITTKLADAERSNIVRTMKSKEIVLKKLKKD